MVFFVGDFTFFNVTLQTLNHHYHYIHGDTTNERCLQQWWKFAWNRRCHIRLLTLDLFSSSLKNMYPPHPDEYTDDMINFLYNNDEIRARMEQYAVTQLLFREKSIYDHDFSDLDLTGSFIQVPSPLSYRSVLPSECILKLQFWVLTEHGFESFDTLMVACWRYDLGQWMSDVRKTPYEKFIPWSNNEPRNFPFGLDPVLHDRVIFRMRKINFGTLGFKMSISENFTNYNENYRFDQGSLGRYLCPKLAKRQPKPCCSIDQAFRPKDPWFWCCIHWFKPMWKIRTRGRCNGFILAALFSYPQHEIAQHYLRKWHDEWRGILFLRIIQRNNFHTWVKGYRISLYRMELFMVSLMTRNGLTVTLTSTIDTSDSDFYWFYIHGSPSLLAHASKGCKEHSGLFITPPTKAAMAKLMEDNNLYSADFWTPVKRYNATHYLESDRFRKISDIEPPNLLAQKHTCQRGTSSMLKWDKDFVVTSRGNGLWDQTLWLMIKIITSRL